ncbi:MAG: AAA family ATPase [Synergistaceae bacterium]|nr:AAA family ATPase [Synergistaceae bacterium]
MITSLKLKGFKSLGAEYNFEFSRNFTAIVGPNGSGKSNILDALKWILGEGAASGLRITRQSDLLFQGSKSVDKAELTEVILRLSSDDDKGTLKRIYSDETGSILTFDGKKITLQELEAVKSRFNLNGEGFALIGQGEISAAIHQRPRERRRQLDELFKISHYREKREDTLKRLTEHKEESQRIQTLIAELEQRRSEISDDVKIAVQAQGIIDNLEIIRREYYLFKRSENERNESDLQAQKHNIISELDKLRRYSRFWRLALKYYEEKLTSGVSQENYKSQLEEINSRKNSIHRLAFQSASQVHSIQERRKFLVDELAKLQAQKLLIAEERRTAQDEKNNLSQEVRVKKEEFSERKRIFQEAQLQAQRDSSKRTKLLEDIANFTLKRSKLAADINALGTSEKNNLQEIQKLQAQQKEKQIIIDKLSERKKALDEKFTSLSISSRKQNSEVKAIRQELNTLENRYNSLSSTNIYSTGIFPEPVRLILEASKKNLLQSKPQAAADVFSCLSSDVAEAIEAYLGIRQYYLLVHTIEEAQEGINMLKRTKSGRVTYLALERCRPRNIDTRINVGGKVTGWAMDLITVKDEWINAISHLMGDLLIVEDYDTAGKLMREGVRFPIATLEGEVFAPSGAISGGVSRQRAGAVVAKQKFDEVNAQLETLRNSINEVKETLQDGLEREKNLRLEFEEVSNQLEAVRDEINSAQRELKSTTRELERIISEHMNSEAHSQKLLEDFDETGRILQELEITLAELPDPHEVSYEHVISPLERELTLLQDKLNVTAALYKRVNDEFITVTANIERTQGEISSGESLEDEHRKKLSELGREKVRAYREELELRRQAEKHKDESANVKSKLEFVRAKVDKLNSNISSVNNQVSEFEAKILQIENEINQLIELWGEKYPYDPDEARQIDNFRELSSSMRRLERELKVLGDYNLGALSEDKSLISRVEFLTEQLEDVNNAAEELSTWIENIDAKVENEFTASMRRIDARFNELFQRLFGGGEAHLKLQPAQSIWDRGVEIFAQPPGKNLQNMTSLSGGEQSLTSTALIFATLEEAKTPLAVLDEIDAALDEYNLLRLAELIKEYSRTIQIIAMTHRRITMESADILYGVTMFESEPGLTQTTAIDPKNFN